MAITAMLLMLTGAGCHADPGYQGRSSDQWIMALDDTSSRTRAEAAIALGHVLRIAPRSPRVVRALVRTLGDRDDLVRMAAAASLATEGVRAEGAVPGIHAALHDSAHAEVRAEAALILGHLSTETQAAAVPALVHALSDPDGSVRGTAAEALGTIGPRAAAPAIPALLRVAAGDTNAFARLHAVQALSDLRAGEPAVVALFDSALRDASAPVREAAAYALAAAGPAAAAPAAPSLAGALADSAVSVRAAAAYALVQLGGRASAAGPALERARDDPDDRVRGYAAAALARIREARPR